MGSKEFWKIFLLGAFIVLFILSVAPSVLGSAPLVVVMFLLGFVLIWLSFATQDKVLLIAMLILLGALMLLYLWPGIQVVLPYGISF